MKIRCVIADDEAPARRVLEHHVMGRCELELVGSCQSAAEVFAAVASGRVDLLFLDIQMPVVLGTELLRRLKDPPAVIFVTAYPGYALESYELGAADYLMKPVTPERFGRAVDRFIASRPQNSRPDHIYVKEGSRLVKIPLCDLVYIQSVKDYLVLRLGSGTHVTHMTLRAMEELLEGAGFLRVHRSYLVNESLLEEIGQRQVRVAGYAVPLGKTYRRLRKGLY